MMSIDQVLKLGALVAGGWLLGSGCRSTVLNADHCAVNDGDAHCLEMFPDGSRPFCRRGTESCVLDEGINGCVFERPADECYSPCGGRENIIDNGECVMGEESTSGSTSEGMTGESGSTTEGSSTTGPMPCSGNEDCMDAAAPFCNPTTEECVSCQEMDDPDGACAELDASNPLCVGGVCVACTPENPIVCDDQRLLCDSDTNACVPCTEHDQCTSGACELAVGLCFPEDFVVHVDGDGGADYTSIVAAVNAVDDGTYGVIIVHELTGGVSYQAAGGLIVDGAKIIALLAAPSEAPIIQGTGMNPGLRAQDAGTVLYVDGLTLSNGAAQGLVVDEAFTWADRSRIVGNDGGGIVAQNASELTLRNCFVGGDVNDINALEAIGANVTALYSTVGGGFGSATALTCDVGSSVAVRNSLLVARTDGDELACPPATVERTAAEMDLGGTNTVVGPMDTLWFVGYGTGAFSLSAMAPASISTAARWMAGDPATDIDGDPRPTTDGAMDYAGADAVP